MEPEAPAPRPGPPSSRGRAREAPDLAELAGLDEEGFRERFRSSPVKRAKRRGLLRNVAVAIGNAGGASHRPPLERLAGDHDPLVASTPRWALARLDAAPQRRRRLFLSSIL